MSRLDEVKAENTKQKGELAMRKRDRHGKKSEKLENTSDSNPASWHLNEALKDTKVVCLSAGTGAVHLALLACGVGPGDEVCAELYLLCFFPPYHLLWS